MLPPVIERLRRDHDRIKGVARELFELIDGAEDRRDDDWQRMVELLGFLTYYADRIHHPLEDRLFDRLLNKGLTPTERRLLFRNLSQHEEITMLTEELARDARLAQAGGVPAENEFSEKLTGYLNLQRQHMTFEETQLFPLLEARFDNTDWNEITATSEPEQDYE